MLPGQCAIFYHNDDSFLHYITADYESLFHYMQQNLSVIPQNGNSLFRVQRNHETQWEMPQIISYANFLLQSGLPFYNLRHQINMYQLYTYYREIVLKCRRVISVWFLQMTLHTTVYYRDSYSSNRQYQNIVVQLMIYFVCM